MKERTGFLKPSAFPFSGSDHREGDLRSPSDAELDQVLHPDHSRRHGPREDQDRSVILLEERWGDGNGFD